ncbi:hypothetical protein LJR129_001220 [Acidovorax sp. LjRoot129]|uniref:hypothetical protein n=1 Tax=Acidovorax sp. LjRoot129 TaxID=3342260 RepID=UPI003ECFFCD7
MDLLPLAALLERAYRLALVVQDDRAISPGTGEFLLIELVDVLDEARVALLAAHRTFTVG